MQLCPGLYNSVNCPNLWRCSKSVLHLFWSESGLSHTDEFDINNKTSLIQNDSACERVVIIYQRHGDEAKGSVRTWKEKESCGDWQSESHVCTDCGKGKSVYSQLWADLWFIGQVRSTTSSTGVISLQQLFKRSVMYRPHLINPWFW